MANRVEYPWHRRLCCTHPRTCEHLVNYNLMGGSSVTNLTKVCTFFMVFFLKKYFTNLSLAYVR
jgi:hypothetical protein